MKPGIAIINGEPHSFDVQSITMSEYLAMSQRVTPIDTAAPILTQFRYRIDLDPSEVRTFTPWRHDVTNCYRDISKAIGPEGPVPAAVWLEVRDVSDMLGECLTPTAKLGGTQ